MSPQRWRMWYLTKSDFRIIMILAYHVERIFAILITWMPRRSEEITCVHGNKFRLLHGPTFACEPQHCHCLQDVETCYSSRAVTGIQFGCYYTGILFLGVWNTKVSTRRHRRWICKSLLVIVTELRTASDLRKDNMDKGNGKQWTTSRMEKEPR